MSREPITRTSLESGRSTCGAIRIQATSSSTAKATILVVMRKVVAAKKKLCRGGNLRSDARGCQTVVGGHGRLCETIFQAAGERQSVNATDCTPDTSKRLRQRRFLHITMSSRRTM